MAVVCACLPTLRPIWRHIFPKATATGNSSYELGYGTSGRRVTRKNNTNSTPYAELDEMELRDGARDRDRSTSPEGRDILKETTIHQTVEVSDSSSTANLRSNEAGFWSSSR